MEDPSKRLKNPSATGTKDNISEDFWNSSPLGMDHSAGQSQRSISSIGISNHTSDPQSSSSSQNDPPEFINHGKFSVTYLLWIALCVCADAALLWFPCILFSYWQKRWNLCGTGAHHYHGIIFMVLLIIAEEFDECRSSSLEPNKAAMEWKQKVWEEDAS